MKNINRVLAMGLITVLIGCASPVNGTDGTDTGTTDTTVTTTSDTGTNTSETTPVATTTTNSTDNRAKTTTSSSSTSGGTSTTSSTETTTTSSTEETPTSSTEETKSTEETNTPATVETTLSTYSGKIYIGEDSSSYITINNTSDFTLSTFTSKFVDQRKNIVAESYYELNSTNNAYIHSFYGFLPSKVYPSGYYRADTFEVVYDTTTEKAYIKCVYTGRIGVNLDISKSFDATISPTANYGSRIYLESDMITYFNNYYHVSL